MAVLVWDRPKDRKYETGISKCVLYPMVGRGYPKGVAWNGLTSITETLSGGDPTKIYADDIKYLELRANEDFQATIEAYGCPKEFKVCDGTEEFAAGISIGQQPRRAFGLCYRTKIGNGENDEAGYRLHLIYNATVAPSERAYQTINDSPEAITFSWEAATTPTVVKNYKPTSFVIVDSTQCLPDHLIELESILYGTADADPRLPLPDEVMDIMGGDCSFYYLDPRDGHLKLDAPHYVESNFLMHIYDDGHLYYISPNDQPFDVYLNQIGHLFIEEVNINGN